MFTKKTKARTYSVSFLSDKKCKVIREYFSWGQKDKLARRRNLLAPWSLFVRQNIHSTRSIDDDVDDVDDEYGDEFDLDDNMKVTTSVNMVTSRPEKRSSLLSRLCERSFVKNFMIPMFFFSPY